MHFFYVDENEYDTDTEYNECRELSGEVAYEEWYDKKMLIVNHYRDLLYYEPEFIGIKNISCHKILNIIENTKNPIYLRKNDYKLNTDQIYIFNCMYRDLFKSKKDKNIYNSVVKKIFQKIYV
jgi:hypothetical protein